MEDFSGKTEYEDELEQRIAELEQELADYKSSRVMVSVKYARKLEIENQRLREAARILYRFVLEEVSAEMSDDEIAEIVEPLAALLREGCDD